MTAVRKLEAVSNDVPDPPYPTDLRAKGFTFSIDWELVKQGKTWILCPPDMRPWLILLWSWSWTNSPAGSYDNDDELIAASIGMDHRLFMANRDRLMRGWTLHSDGRLYHEHITKLVLGMADRREKDRARVAAYREREAQKASGTPADVTHDTHERSRVFDTGTVTGTGTGEEKKKAPRKRSAAAAPLVSVDNLVDEGVDRAVAVDWLTVRKAKTLPLTPTAWQGVKDEAAKAGMAIDLAVKTSVINGWGGFKAKWMDQPATLRFTQPGQGTTASTETTSEYLERRRVEQADADANKQRAQSPASIAAKHAAIERVKGTKAAA